MLEHFRFLSRIGTVCLLLNHSKRIKMPSRLWLAFSGDCTVQPFKRSDLEDRISFSDGFNKETKTALLNDMIVIDDFLSTDEEKSLYEEIDPYLKKLRYEFDHWDNAIHGYRETERLKWTAQNNNILNRVRSVAFPPDKPQLHHVHVLDLAEKGYIKPHIDSIRFCGDTIAGLSLLSSCVMRLVHDKDKSKVADILLNQRSLYIMKDSARYDYTHEVLSKEDSQFKGENVPRGRRISIICRSEISKTDL